MAFTQYLARTNKFSSWRAEGEGRRVQQKSFINVVGKKVNKYMLRDISLPGGLTMDSLLK